MDTPLSPFLKEDETNCTGKDMVNAYDLGYDYSAGRYVEPNKIPPYAKGGVIPKMYILKQRYTLKIQDNGSSTMSPLTSPRATATRREGVKKDHFIIDCTEALFKWKNEYNDLISKLKGKRNHFLTFKLNLVFIIQHICSTFSHPEQVTKRSSQKIPKCKVKV